MTKNKKHRPYFFPPPLLFHTRRHSGEWGTAPQGWELPEARRRGPFCRFKVLRSVLGSALTPRSAFTTDNEVLTQALRGRARRAAAGSTGPPSPQPSSLPAAHPAVGVRETAAAVRGT